MGNAQIDPTFFKLGLPLQSMDEQIYSFDAPNLLAIFKSLDTVRLVSGGCLDCALESILQEELTVLKRKRVLGSRPAHHPAERKFNSSFVPRNVF